MFIKFIDSRVRMRNYDPPFVVFRVIFPASRVVCAVFDSTYIALSLGSSMHLSANYFNPLLFLIFLSPLFLFVRFWNRHIQYYV